jgi:ribonuclease D
MKQEFSYVNDEQRLSDVVDALRRAPVVAFDTEFVGEKTYEPQLCLLQVATEEAIWVIDPLSGIDLQHLWAVLTEPGREVVALAARQEILFCLRHAGRPPAILFDPQVAAGLVGLGYPLSHTNLVLKVLQQRLPAGETFTDWRRRPLSPAQLEYAASDVCHLLEVRARLMERAKSLGREEWVRGECAALVTRTVDRDAAESWVRVGPVAKLKPREQAVAREVWRWRDRAARAADVPARRILGDDLLMQVVKRQPQSTTALLALRGFERPGLRKQAAEIVAAVKHALDLPEDQLPRLRRRDDPPQVQTLGQLCSVVANNLAAQHRVDPALLATAADLQDLVRWHLGVDGFPPPPILDGWRGEILGRPLLDVLSGKSVIRVADARHRSPICLEAVPSKA